MHIIHAPNGGGKTNFINAMTWCIYGKELFPAMELTNLRRVNHDVLEDARKKNVKNIVIEVRLYAVIEAELIQFFRKSLIDLSSDGEYKDEIIVSKYDSEKIEKILTGDEAAQFIDMYFQSNLKQHMFIDLFRNDYMFHNKRMFLPKISDEMKNKIEIRMNKYFKTITGKVHLTIQIKINEKYCCELICEDEKVPIKIWGQEDILLLQLSVLMAYSDIVEIEIPMIIDSPFSMLSGNKRVNLMKVFLKISRMRQVIILTSQEEFLREFMELIEGNMVSRLLSTEE
jgi:DNA repair exonuclease SbcCD ATPase subunit